MTGLQCRRVLVLHCRGVRVVPFPLMSPLSPDWLPPDWIEYFPRVNALYCGPRASIAEIVRACTWLNDHQEAACEAQ